MIIEKYMTKTKEVFANFMKNQAKNEKNNISEHKNNQKSSIKTAKEECEEKEKEELQEAKKQSASKASNYDQSMMFVRLLSETTAKYVAMILLLIGATLAIIKGAPLFFAMLRDLIFKLFVG